MCTFDGCNRPQESMGHCSAHAQQRRKGTDLKPLRSAPIKAKFRDGTRICAYCETALPSPPRGSLCARCRPGCVVSDCSLPSAVGSYCRAHYRQARSGVPFSSPRPHTKAVVGTDGRKVCAGCGRDIHGSKESFCTSCKNRKRQYGVTQYEYLAMLTEQGGKCPGCGSSSPTCIDHDHETGRVRGLLCVKCNLALGHASDDPGRLRRLANYLDANRTQGGPRAL